MAIAQDFGAEPAAAGTAQGVDGARGEVLPTAETSPAEIDRAVSELSDSARGFAQAAPLYKAGLLRELIPRVLEVAREQVGASCRAKGIDPDAPIAGEEWLAGPCPVLFNIRLLAEALTDIAARGRPALPRKALRRRKDGRVEVNIFPSRATDSVIFSGFRCHVLLTPGAGEKEAAQASFYQQKDPEGGVSLVLGAGNVSSIGPMDALYKLFVEGKVVLLKMSPVNAYLGPIFERAFSPLIERKLLRIVYGGAATGAYLSAHPGITDIHITGSARTHDLIVWGPEGPDQTRRKAENDPFNKKPITSELGNVSPIVVVPRLYSEDELAFQAKNVVSQVVNNASFNCNAAKMLVLPKGWAQRQLFLDKIQSALQGVPPRRAYYPGAHDRHASLTGGRSEAARLGQATEGTLPWTMVTGLDPQNQSEPLFTTEPFCGMLSEVSIGSNDPVEFLAEAVRFCNDTLWGTLNCAITIHPQDEEDPAIGKALDEAILALRYGAIAINHWPALVYGFVVPPWGGHPSATLANVQSGIGFVHNTFMIEGIEKAVVRGPLRASPKPPFFYDNKQMAAVGERLAGYAAAPGWGKVPGIAFAALRG
jgi:acyl-CoA reductase-like NAD-dependent aldehyde dehydrogenase